MAVDPTKLAERLRDPGLEFEEDVAPLLAEAVERTGEYEDALDVLTDIIAGSHLALGKHVIRDDDYTEALRLLGVLRQKSNEGYGIERWLRRVAEATGGEE